MSYTALDYSDIDARWDTHAPNLSRLDKALILWFGSTALRIVTAPHAEALSKEDLLDSFGKYTNNLWRPRDVESALTDLLSKHLFKTVDDGRIYLNVVGYPKINNYLHISEFYAFLLSRDSRTRGD